MSEQRTLCIYGAGGHGLVVVDAALSCEWTTVLGVLDDNSDRHGMEVCGVPVIGGREALDRADVRRASIVLAIGCAADRRRLDREFRGLGIRFGRVIHPAAHIARGTTIGEGTVVLPMCVLHSHVVVGRHAIVNTAATVDHHGQIGDFAHIAPGAHLAGHVTVGEAAHVGIGAAITAGVTIGDGAVVGAGAAVVEDVPAGVVVVGVPARVFRKD